MADSVEERIRLFKSTLTTAVPLHASPIDWSTIDAQISKAEEAINALEALENPIDDAALSQVLEQYPLSRQLIESILGLPSNQLSSSSVNADGGRDSTSDLSLAQQILSMGFGRLLRKGTSVRDLYAVSLVISGAASRKIRQGRWLGDEVEKLLARTVVDLREKKNINIAFTSTPTISKKFRKRVDYLVTSPGLTPLAIRVAFQEQYGGRQYRDLTTTYPQLADELSKAKVRFLVIADGPGLRSAPQTALALLFKGVRNCLNWNQATSGGLVDAIFAPVDSAPMPVNRPPDVTELVRALLERGLPVNAGDLPLEAGQARLAMANFIGRNPDLSLQLNTDGTELRWQGASAVQALLELQSNPSGEDVLKIGLSVLKPVLSKTEWKTNEDVPTVLAHAIPDSILPSQIAVFGATQSVTRELCASLSRKARALAPSAKLALLLSADDVPASVRDDFRQTQRSLAVGIVLLDRKDLLEFVRTKGEVRDKLVREILRSSDLSKANPFVVNSVTPARIFFGRAEEVATVLSTLTSSSAALLGGRRIGKTSLMRHVEARLRDEGANPVFIDCQAAKTWTDFGDLLRRHFGDLVPQQFSPSKLLAAFDSQVGPTQRPVLLLDEIDQLLHWDSVNRENEVPEALFKVFRTLSQAGTAQFLFSGERMVASKIGDPHSPHWNFCRPIMLRQLAKFDAQELLVAPLKAMSVELPDESGVRDLVWARTNGHPQIVQSIGAALVRELNERPPLDRQLVRLEALVKYVDSYEFAEHYLETYWGQATRVEQALSLLIAKGTQQVADLRTDLVSLGYEVSIEELGRSLRMLEIYGIVDRVQEGYAVRATWFSDATKPYGGLDALLKLRSATS